jgi:hypothetical protein
MKLFVMDFSFSVCYQNDIFLDLFFIFDINTSKPLKNTSKCINLMFFGENHFKKQVEQHYQT